jgi:hypothetical protein
MFQVKKSAAVLEMCDAGRPQPRQFFLENFMSHHTPYNGLLFYHGLGAGKSEILRMVREEYSEYMQKTNRVKPIYAPDSDFQIDESDYDGALFILDDVHRRDYSFLKPLLQKATVKLLLLSPTPLLTNPTDLVDLLNLLRLNDKRRPILASSVFDAEMNLLDDGAPLAECVRGYVSFVQGENPYSFPFRVYPQKKWKYPKIKRSGNVVPRVEILDVFPVYPEKPQQAAYFKAKTDEEGLMALNMSYPGGLFGPKGFEATLNPDYTYKGVRVFDPDVLPEYSAKLAAMCRSVQKATGIILVYTRFDPLPVALALESIGFSRHTGVSLLGRPKTALKYALWDGAPNSEWAAATHPDNAAGDLLKVVIVTEVDGVDLVNVRQIHVLDPWPHMERLERVIERGIRLCSHKILPLEARNCQIYLYASLWSEEGADLFVYRQAETNALKVGQVTRLMRLNAAECVVNYPEPTRKSVVQVLADGQIIQYPLAQDGSAACDYLKCLNAPEKPVLDLETEISRVFQHHYVLTAEELVREVRLLSPQHSRGLILKAAQDLVDREEVVTDRVGTPGRLVHGDRRFLFQPFEKGPALAKFERDLQNDPWCALVDDLGACVGHLIDRMPDCTELFMEVRPHSKLEKEIFDYFQKNKYENGYVFRTKEGLKYFTLDGEPTSGDETAVRKAVSELKLAQYVGVVDGEFKVLEGRKGRDCFKIMKELKKRPLNRQQACAELEVHLRRNDSPSKRCFLTPLENSFF